MTNEKWVSPLIAALDIGSSSTRITLYDATARTLPHISARRAYQPDVTHDGSVTYDPHFLLQTICEVIDEFNEEVLQAGLVVDTVAVDTLWHSLMGVDAKAQPLTPLFTYADTRSATIASQLQTEVDASALHQRTGCRLHASYYPAKLRWLASTQAEVFAATHHWLSLGEFLFLQLFGETGCSLSMASGTGLLNWQSNQWDDTALALAGITEQHLSPLVDLDMPMTSLRPEYAKRWVALAKAHWLPAVGDGASANIGSNGFSDQRIALMSGTTSAMRITHLDNSQPVPDGLWRYRVNRKYLVTGGALSEGGNFYAWCRRTFQLHPDPAGVERQLEMLHPDSHGLTVLPFLAGERSPGWRATARAVISGFSLDTEPIEVLRAGLEAIACRFTLIYQRLTPLLMNQEAQIIASGGALLSSPVWLQICADVLGRPVLASAEVETTSRGTVLLALDALGLFGNVSETIFSPAKTYLPDLEHHRLYEKAVARQASLYQQIYGDII